MAKFKTEMPPDVMHFADVPGYIQVHEKDDLVKLEQIPEVAEVILSWQATLSRERTAAHVENLRKNHPPRQASSIPPASAEPAQGGDAAVPVCPKCGAPMVLRTRKSDGGSFWGCSAYPRCRGIRDAQPTA